MSGAEALTVNAPQIHYRGAEGSEIIPCSGFEGERYPVKGKQVGAFPVGPMTNTTGFIYGRGPYWLHGSKPLRAAASSLEHRKKNDMHRLLALAAMTFALSGLSAYQPEPPNPCAPAKLECLLAEGAELDGAAGFTIPFTYDGKGAMRCVIISAKNAGVVVGASPTYTMPLFPGLYGADFRGQTNAEVLVFGYLPGTNQSTNTVKAKIVGNPSP